jgi:hypothetical protein
MSWEDKLYKAQMNQKVNVVQTLYSDEIEKARSGIYADTPYNRKKGLVGQHYGGKKQEELKIEPYEMTFDKYYKKYYEIKLKDALKSIRTERQKSMIGDKSQYIYYLNNKKSNFAYKTENEAKQKAEEHAKSLYSKNNARNEHLFEIAKALSMNKQLPIKVLKDYPELNSIKN